MMLAYDEKNLKELTEEEMLGIDGGITFAQAMDVAAIAISIVGIGMTPYALVAAVGRKALIAAAAKGVGAVIGLISSVA
jgi:hypothetical protein